MVENIVFRKPGKFCVENEVFQKRQQIQCGKCGFQNKNSKLIVKNMVFEKKKHCKKIRSSKQNQQTHCKNVVFPPKRQIHCKQIRFSSENNKFIVKTNPPQNANSQSKKCFPQKTESSW